jgi:hypothetical protein
VKILIGDFCQYQIKVFYAYAFSNIASDWEQPQYAKRQKTGQPAFDL